MGSVVRQLAIEEVGSWKRLSYELVNGSGPRTGWVTMHNAQKEDLLIPSTNDPADELGCEANFNKKRRADAFLTELQWRASINMKRPAKQAPLMCCEWAQTTGSTTTCASSSSTSTPASSPSLTPHFHNLFPDTQGENVSQGEPTEDAAKLGSLTDTSTPASSSSSRSNTSTGTSSRWNLLHPAKKKDVRQQDSKEDVADLYVEYYSEENRSYRVQNADTGEVFDSIAVIDDTFMKQVREYETNHQDRLSLGHFVRTNEYTVEKLISFAGVTASSVVLDIGCGEGDLLRKLVQQTHCTAIGIEANPLLCAMARRHNKKHNVDDKIIIHEMLAEKLRIEDLGNVTMVFIFLLNVTPLLPLFQKLLAQDTCIVTSRFALPSDRFQQGVPWPSDDTLEGILELMSPSCPMLYKYEGAKSNIQFWPDSPAMPNTTSDVLDGGAAEEADDELGPAGNGEVSKVNDGVLRKALNDLIYFVNSNEGMTVHQEHLDCLEEMLETVQHLNHEKMQVPAMVALMVALVTQAYQYNYLRKKYPESVSIAVEVFHKHFITSCPEDSETASTLCGDESDTASLEELEHCTHFVAEYSGILSSGNFNVPEEQDDEEVINESDAESLANFRIVSAMWEPICDGMEDHALFDVAAGQGSGMAVVVSKDEGDTILQRPDDDSDADEAHASRMHCGPREIAFGGA